MEKNAALGLLHRLSCIEDWSFNNGIAVREDLYCHQ